MKKGDTFQFTFNVNETIYSGFIDLFKDKNPLHTNETFAKDKGFENTVMHGNILNGFLSFFIGECLPVKNVIIQKQDIKYIKPVYLHDIILLQVLIDDVYESVHTIEFKYSFTNQKGIIIAKGTIQIGLLISLL